MATQLEVIKIFMDVLNKHGYTGTDTSKIAIQALDEAIRTCSQYSGIEDAINKFKTELFNAYRNKTTSETEGTILKKVCGIDLSNNDTGAITGLDAGGSTVKGKNDIVPEDTSTDYSIKKYTATTSTGQLIYTSSNGKWIVAGTSADDVIQSYGNDSINAGAGDDNIEVASNEATVIGGEGLDTIVSEYTDSNVNKNLVIGDLSAEDTLLIYRYYAANATETPTPAVQSATFVEGGLIIKTNDDRTITLAGVTSNDISNLKVNILVYKDDSSLVDETKTLADWIGNAPSDSTLADATISVDTTAIASTENGATFDSGLYVKLNNATGEGKFTYKKAIMNGFLQLLSMVQAMKSVQ